MALADAPVAPFAATDAPVTDHALLGHFAQHLGLITLLEAIPIAQKLKRLLLDRVATSFAAEAGDVAARLFGREAAGGVRLLQLLDRTYAVVVTNPPWRL